MKKLVLGILVCAIFIGCGGVQQPQDAAIEINGVGFTVEDFQVAFENSPFMTQEEEGKSEFLQRFISRKLILREAEKEGLDKDPEFLQDVQLFWEQSLLKRMYSLKNKESAVDVKVTDKEIQDFYTENKDYFADKELGQVYSQVKWALQRQQQTESISEWIKQLRRDAKIEVDRQALGIE